jgi:hypothetical protein
MTRAISALISAMAIFLLVGAPATIAIAGDGQAVAAQPEDKPATEGSAKVSGEVDIDVADSDGGAWYLSPTWVVIGVLAVGVLVAIIVAASRGGGTTVIKD